MAKALTLDAVASQVENDLSAEEVGLDPITILTILKTLWDAWQACKANKKRKAADVVDEYKRVQAERYSGKPSNKVVPAWARNAIKKNRKEIEKSLGRELTDVEREAAYVAFVRRAFIIGDQVESLKP